ncbi:hypothetical protein ACHHYP_06573, partial [Achlya hypogyna]
MFDRICTHHGYIKQLVCASGTIIYGNPLRPLVLGGINVGTIIFVYSCAFYATSRSQKTSRPSHLLSAAAVAFLDPPDDYNDDEPALGTMSGLFLFRWKRRLQVFDTKLWMCFNHPLRRPSTIAIPVNSMRTRRARAKVFLGLGYLACTIASSISYLKLTSVNLANDFWWVAFNATGLQTFIANWYNWNIWVTPSLLDAHLDSATYASMLSYAADATTPISFAKTYSGVMQYEVASSLPLAIRGLRQTDACLVPWIAAQYCYLDFDRRWEMANSAARQQRCFLEFRTNGAVYLEGPLRNVDWIAFDACWGDAFRTGIASDLALDAAGVAWLAAVKRAATTEDAEVLLWQAKGIASYTTAWQNYKSIGLLNSFNVVNAFGLAYPLTLYATNGSFALATETTRKMYWSFAADLWAVATNGSGATGRSLLRSSARFAFTNTTLGAVYVTNGSMQAPLDPAYAVFESTIGAFGSVDLRHVPFPASLARLARTVHETLNEVVGAVSNDSHAAQKAFKNLFILSAMLAVPSGVNTATLTSVGSNMLCNMKASQLNLTSGYYTYFGYNLPCNSGQGEWIYPYPLQTIFALAASGIAIDAAAAVPVACATEMSAPASCRASLLNVSSFITTFMAAQFLSELRVLAIDVETDIAALRVEFMMYLKDATTGNVSLFHQPILDPSDAPMIFTGWILAFDWVTGLREVVAFEGDKGALTVISTTYDWGASPAKSSEVPVNVAAYFRVFCQYISFALLMIATTAVLHTVVNGCNGEGYNLFEVNRVGGMVWIGRPLLFVRSLTALCI